MNDFQLYSHSWIWMRSSTWPEKSNCGTRTSARSRATSRLPSKRRPFQFCSGERPRLRHGLSSKCGAPRSSPRRSYVQRWIGQTMLAALPRPFSMIACRWRQMFEMSSMPSRVAHERLRVVARLERAIVAGVRDHQLVAGVARRAREQLPLLGLERRGIAVPGDGELRRRAPQMPDGGKTGHRPSLSSRKSVEPTNPTQQPGTITAFSAAPDRFAKSAARKDRVRPRHQKMLV